MSSENQEVRPNMLPLMIMAFAVLVFAVSESGHSHYAASPAGKHFEQTDVAYYEWIHTPDYELTCNVMKWKPSWMPTGYIAQLTEGEDQTTHNFGTLTAAETFLAQRGCHV